MRRRTTRLAWALWGLCATLLAPDLLLFAAYGAPSRLESTFMMVPFVVATFATVGALVAARRPQNPIGWLFCVGALLWGLGLTAQQYAIFSLVTRPGALPGGVAMAWLASWVMDPGVLLLLTLACLFFPTGRLPSPRWRPVAWLAIGVTVAHTLTNPFAPGPLKALVSLALDNPLGRPWAGALRPVEDVLIAGTILACLASVVLRFRGAQGVERAQLKWIAYAVLLLAIGSLGVQALVIMVGSPGGRMSAIASPAIRSSFLMQHRQTPWFLVISALGSLGLAAFPAAVGIAILRYRLWDIDLLINRTLVYGALTAIIGGGYVLVVGGLGSLLARGAPARGNLLLSLLATGLVAVLFAPLRDRVQRAVNHLMYGERDDPYTVLARLDQRLAATLAPDAVLPALVESIAQTLKLPYVAIAAQRDDGCDTAAAYGRPVAEPLRLPLEYQGEAVGQLVLAPRAVGETFTPAEARLLQDLARHAGVAVQAVQVTADLQRSRERLVVAREEERRRLRRDLHDGLGPQLAGLMLRLETARNRLADDPAAEVLLHDLAGRMKAAVSDIRRLVYALRPPALDELGLVGALQEAAAEYGQADHTGVGIAVDAPAYLPPLPAAVEVAAYRIAQEALTNVVRHAHAHTCTLQLALDAGRGVLDLAIEDDGQGVAAGQRGGVGLRSMRERAEELGGTCTIEARPEGGTRVRAHLPCRLAEAAAREPARVAVADGEE